MPLIPFPDVPDYPGVPPIVRSAVSSTPVNIALNSLGSILLSAVQSPTQWGIFDQKGNQLGGVAGLTLVENFTTQPKVLSTFSFDYMKETRISDFPLEAGSFANFNKVEMPATPVVTLALSGTEEDRSAFLLAIDMACKSTDLYNVATPEFTYTNYSLVRYRYSRRAERGATLLMLELSMEEVRTVSAAYSKVSPTANPQSASAVPQSDSGNVQPKTPDVSTLQSLASKFTALVGGQ